MNAATFKKGVTRILLDRGFRSQGKSLRRDQSNVSVLVSFEKGFGNQWFVNVGFWLRALGELATDRVEQSHLYFRLERLLPASVILAAGALNDTTQSQAYETLVRLLTEEVDTLLTALGTDEGLRDAMKTSKLSHGLIRKEAREYLEA